MKTLTKFVLPILGCMFVGYISSLFQIESLQDWYPFLNKPTLTPPNYVFPIAWTLLYIIMGLSIGFILKDKDKTTHKLTILFGIQLGFNFTWSILFFYFQSPLAGLINIILLDITVLLYIIKAFKKHTASALLFIPYLVWLLFATYLNGYILIYN